MTMYRGFSIRPPVLCGVLLCLLVVCRTSAQPPAEAAAVFSRYTGAVEARLLRQHASPTGFLVTTPRAELRLQGGDLVLEQLTPTEQPPGAMLHHWRGTAFQRGVTPAQFERLLRDFDTYPDVFGPQVVEAHAQPFGRDRFRAEMRVRQKHIIPVVLDASYDVIFGQLDLRDGYSTSRSIRIQEIDGAGTGHEHALTTAEEHGFLWSLNTYWTYQERDGGLYVQVESVSLSRSIPEGLGWALRPFVTSVPRDSLEFTMHSAMNALRK